MNWPWGWMRPVPARGGAVDSDRLRDTTRQWDSSPVAMGPWGLCAQPCPARPSQPTQVTRTRGTRGCFPLCLYPSGPWGGSPPSPGTPALDLVPLGTPHSPTCFLTFDNYLFSFSPPEKFKNHKIIFVVGKLASGSCCWWGQGHSTAPSPCASRLGGCREQPVPRAGAGG